MKITIQSGAGEMTMEIDPHVPAEADLALALTAVAQGQTIHSPASSPGYSSPVPPLEYGNDDDDDELPPEELLAPGDSVQQVLDSLVSSPQRDTWHFLRRNDRRRGVSIATVAKRYRISGSAASARCNTLMNLGYATRVSRGYYRATLPPEDDD